jgi:putative DNA primase/helicase
LLSDAKALAALSPNGGARDSLEKWDAADAAAEWSDFGALRKTAHNLAKPFDPGPAFVSYGPFQMSADGLTVEVEKGRGETKAKENIWIAASFEIVGFCRDPHGREWGKFLRWRDPDGRTHNRHVTDSALQAILLRYARRWPPTACESIAHGNATSRAICPGRASNGA